MLGGARRRSFHGCSFEEYLKTADLSQYEKELIKFTDISVNSKNFVCKTSQTDTATDANTTVKHEAAKSISKKAVSLQKKVLPNTGSEQSIFLLLMGMVAGLSIFIVENHSKNS